jgi:hypothetical protein
LSERATHAQVEWAHAYEGYRRLACFPEALWGLIAPVEREPALLTRQFGLNRN